MIPIASRIGPRRVGTDPLSIGIFDFARIFVISDAGIARFGGPANSATLFFAEHVPVVPSAPRIGPGRIGTHPGHAIGTANFTRVFVIADPGIAFFRRNGRRRRRNGRWRWRRRNGRRRWNGRRRRNGRWWDGRRCWRWGDVWRRCWRWGDVWRRSPEQRPRENTKEHDEQNARDDGPKRPR